MRLPCSFVLYAPRLPVANFTTMDTTRILSELGFEAMGLDDEAMNNKTISEQLFEAYLGGSGLTDFRFEPTLEGTLKRPDYSLNVRGTEILFEIKQFDATVADLNFRYGAYDPYGVIREKIEAGRKKFKDLEKYCCCLVLYDNGKPLVDLDWQFIYAAMFGNLGIEMPVNTDTGVADMTQSRRVLHGGGKMFWYLNQDSVKPINITISAILVLRQYMVGTKRFEIGIKRKEKQLGRKLELSEYMDEIERAKGTAADCSLSQLRVIVHENPFARIQLPRELFHGSYDERYAVSEGRIIRIFCGSQLAALEKEEQEAEQDDGSAQ